MSVGDVSLSRHDTPQARKEKLARIVLNGMYQFVGLLDLDGTPLDINQSALDGAGVRLEDIQGRPFWEARWWQASEAARTFARDGVMRASRGEFVQGDIEVYGASQGEELITVDFSLLPIRDEAGRIILLLAEARNVTEKKRVERELAAKNAELRNLLAQIEHLSQLKSELFANISHELRTPLALILGPVASMLTDGDALAPRQRHDLQTVHRNAATLLKYVNELLDLAKFDAKRMALHYTELDAAALGRDAAAHFNALARQQSIHFAVRTPPAMPAQLDAEKFERVILNLLSNAFKSVPAGGQILFALQAVDGGRQIHLSVQDSGPGIDPSLRAAIFGRFQQSGDSSAGIFSGTGLGLTIVKEFVELHGGTIDVSETPLGGASFEVLVPLRAPPGSAIHHEPGTVADTQPYSRWDPSSRILATQPVAHGGPAEPARCPTDAPVVLVAEDNAEMRGFIVSLLGDRYRLRLACDGEQALAMAQAEPPDLVLTDLMMPRLSGDQLVLAMRGQEALAQIPVIVLSARADEALKLKLLSESVQDYITKPFSPDELRARVNNLITLKKARDALQKELDSQNQDVAELTQQLIASKQAQQRSFEEHRESQQLWQAVYQHSAAGIALTDLTGRVLEANPAFEVMLDYGADALKLTSIHDLTPDDEQSETQERTQQLLQGKVAEYHVKRRYKRRDGSLVWAHASVSLIPGSERRSPMLMRIVEDVTERHLAEQRLQQAHNELARVTRATALGELAASIAHEINQPLAGVVANAHAGLRWLANAPPNLGEVHDTIQRIVRDANRASGVVTRIRGFLKRDQQPAEPVRLREVIHEVAGFVSERARTEGIELQLAIADDCPDVPADRVQLQQVLLNLMMNGLDAMQGERRHGRRLEIEARRHLATGVIVAVRDQGVGLDPVTRERIFDAFFTSKPEGLGMGLSISRSIIEAHGGQLWASSNPAGSGSTFQFTIPLEGHDAT